MTSDESTHTPSLLLAKGNDPTLRGNHNTFGLNNNLSVCNCVLDSGMLEYMDIFLQDSISVLMISLINIIDTTRVCKLINPMIFFPVFDCILLIRLRRIPLQKILFEGVSSICRQDDP